MAGSEQERDQELNVDRKTNGVNHIKVIINGSICRYIMILFTVIVVVALALWLAYRPKNPEFSVVEAGIYKLIVLPQSQLSTIMKFTLVTRNPNKHSSIYYDELIGKVLYKDQEITPQVTLSPVFNGKKSTVEMSLVIGGAAVSVTEEVANEIVMRSEIWVRVGLMGRVKWKLGGIIIGYYEVSVECDVLVNNTKLGWVPHSTPCDVDFA